MAPLTMWEEKNTGSNLPAQIELYADTAPGHETTYKFLFMAKGGGSANKSYLYQETKAILNEKAMLTFLDEKLRSLGTAACPPYHLAIVIGGTSAEFALKTAKYASAKYLDAIPDHGDPATGHGFRDKALEEQVLELTRQFGIGAQFGGKYFCHDVRVIRLPRHGASLPIAVAVSCSRRSSGASARSRPRASSSSNSRPSPPISCPRRPTSTSTPRRRGQLDRGGGNVVEIDLNQPMSEILAELTKHPVKTRLSLTGTVVVARDIAHAKIRSASTPARRCRTTSRTTRSTTPARPRPPRAWPRARSARRRPAGWTPMSTSSRPPAARWSCSPRATGASRSPTPAAGPRRLLPRLDRRPGGPAGSGLHQVSVEVLEYPELGMEAIWKIEVEDFPAFIVVDDKGNDFFAEVTKPVAMTIEKRPGLI